MSQENPVPDTHAASSGEAHGHPDDHGDRPSHLQHHFDTSEQQFSSSKLGMWLFLATELLFFGGLFCWYLILRVNHPEILHFGSQYLDKTLGGVNTVVLLVSSFTMAAGVSFAQRGQRKALVACLLLTILGGAGFMGIKFVEYRHKFHEKLLWGGRFYEPRDPDAHASADSDSVASPAVTAERAADPVLGKENWDGTCRSCHGEKGQGIAGQGKDMRGSEFITSSSDAELLAFVKVGRRSWDPANTTQIDMPAKGGNPMFGERELKDVIAYLRTFPLAQPAGEGAVPKEVADVTTTDEPAAEFWIPKSSIAPPRDGPTSFVHAAVADRHPQHPPQDHVLDPQRPVGAHLFFSVYFCLTGLHGIHVLCGMLAIGLLVVPAMKGRYGPEYFTPVDLIGLYWHLVDLIWIFLFPLLYLI